MRIIRIILYVVFIGTVLISSTFLASNSIFTNPTPPHTAVNSSFVDNSHKITGSSIIKGGSNFSTATVLNIGAINGSFDSSDSYDQYFKINLNASSTIVFTNIINPNIIMNIYDPSQQYQLGSDSQKNVLHVQITIPTTGFYYIDLFRGVLTLNTNFTLTISNPVNGPLGSSSIGSAVLITPGTFSNNFTTSQSDQYFQLYLQSGTDIYVNVFGESNNLYLYNSSSSILEQDPATNPTLKISIIKSDYYYIRVSHSLNNSGIMTITISTQSSGSIFYADGGNSLTTATLIPIGTTQNRFTSGEGSDYFKVNLTSSQIATFTFKPLSKVSSTSNVDFSVYYPNQTLTTSTSFNASNSQISPSGQLIITITSNGTYYINASFPYLLDYQIIVSTSPDATDGGSGFSLATTLTLGNYTGYLTDEESSDYYKIILTKGYDVNLAVTGECNNLYVYNSSTYLLGQDPVTNPTIKLSITITGYYYIRIAHTTGNFGSYHLSITTQSSGSIFYADGGNSLATATLIPLGIVQNNFISGENYDYFKVNLTRSQIATFTFRPISQASYPGYVYFYVYYPNQTLITSRAIYVSNSQSPSGQLIITTMRNGTYYIEASFSYLLDYQITVSTSPDATDGGGGFSSATTLTPGNYTGYLTFEEQSDYYKILLTKGYDVNIAVTGECNNLYYYNSSTYLLGQDPVANPTIKLSITITGYYYIRIAHTTGNFGSYHLNITTQSSGSILFADGGNSLATATLIPLGTVQSRFTSGENYDFFKVNLTSSQIATFTFTPISKASSSYYVYFYVYYPNQTLITSRVLYVYSSQISPSGQLVITTINNGTYYIEAYFSYLLDYQITVSTSPDTTNGGGGFSSATTLTLGNYTGYLTFEEQSDYYKILLTKGYDVNISVTGECNSLYYYNSSTNLLGQDPVINPSIKFSIISTGYYYIRIAHTTGNYGSYRLNITTEPTGSIFFADGGNSLATATLIPMGTVQSRFTSNDGNDYFKVSFNSSQIIMFTFKPLPQTFVSTYLYFYVYYPNQTFITSKSIYLSSSQMSTPNQLAITTILNGTYYIRVSYYYSLDYQISISSSPDATNGGGSFSSATTLTSGNYTGYLTFEEQSDYYKILLTKGYDVNITVTGECNNLYIYNSSTYLLEWDPVISPTIKLSITSTGYYYFKIAHNTGNFGNYSLFITTMATGSIFYADGGNSLGTATFIPLGTVQSRFTSGDYYDFFKVNLTSSHITVFTFTPLSKGVSYSSLYLNLYNPNQGLIKSYSFYPSTTQVSSPIHLVINTTTNGTYYIRASYSYTLDYRIRIAYSYYPSQPTNIQTSFNDNTDILTISWTDSNQSNLTYFIYMNSFPIYSISNPPLNFKASAINRVNSLTLLGNVSSGVQKFEMINPASGNYYFAVIAVNSEGLSSPISPGISSTSNSLVISYPLTTNPNTFSNNPYSSSYYSSSSSSSSTLINSSDNSGGAILLLLLFIIGVVVFSGYAFSKSEAGKRYLEERKNRQTHYRNNNLSNLNQPSHEQILGRNNQDTVSFRFNPETNNSSNLKNNSGLFVPRIELEELSDTSAKLLMEQFKAPTYELALATINGNFPDYTTYSNAIQVGANTFDQFKLVQQYNTPDYQTAKRIIDGQFQDYEQLLYAEFLGASTRDQLHLVEQFGTPDYQTAKRILDGDFENYDQLLEAEKLSAVSLEQLNLTKSLQAPNYQSALKIREGNFENIQQYTRALSVGARSLEQLNLIDSMEAPNYNEASKASVSGFSNYPTYKKALSEGFTDVTSWQLYQNRNQKLLGYINNGSDVPRETFMQELDISDTDELLSLLDSLNIPTQGSNILFSSFNKDFDPSPVIRQFTSQRSNQSYKEFQFGSNSLADKPTETCKICFKPLTGNLGSCPECTNTFHHKCMLDWVINKKTCPICQQKLISQNVIQSKRNSSASSKNSCTLCSKHFNNSDYVIRCEKCFNLFHKSEFLEWIKIKGICPKCKEKIQF